MFRKGRQCGFIPVLQSFGSSPLEIWGSKVKQGCIRRVTDEQVRALALELASTNVSTCFIYSPKNPRASLGIGMPFFVMIVKNMSRYFTFEITVLDDRNCHRRFRMSNFQKMIQVQHFSATMPLCLEPGWNEIYFDLADITRKAYKSNYVETVRLQIHANCRIRVIYFCDRIYEDKDIPQKLKMFLPTTHECRKKTPEDDEKVEAEMDEYGESELSEEEEEMYYVESVKSVEEAIADGGIIEERFSLMSRLDEGEGGDLSEEDFADDEFEKIKKEESIKEEVIKEESIVEEVKEEESVKEESVKEEPIQEESVNEEAVKEEAQEAETDVKQEPDTQEENEAGQAEIKTEEG